MFYLRANLQGARLKRSLRIILGFERAQRVLNLFYAGPDFDRTTLLSRRAVLRPKIAQLRLGNASKQVSCP